MSEEQDSELRKELDLLRKDIIELKATLNKIHADKERNYKEKQDVKQQIITFITDIRSSKKTRDELTSVVKVAKEKRHVLSDQIKEKIDEVKKLKSVRDSQVKKKGGTINPSILRSEMNALERKIETEVISFEKEKQFMKLIKEKKKQLDEYKGVNAADEKIRNLSREIDTLKKAADKEHDSMQNTADQSQKKHENLLATSKSIDELRAKEKELQTKYDNEKKKFSEVNEEYKKKAERAREISITLGEVYKERDRRTRETTEQILAEKEQVVEEKIKKRQKLTTEDILLFQRMNQ